MLSLFVILHLRLVMSLQLSPAHLRAQMNKLGISLILMSFGLEGLDIRTLLHKMALLSTIVARQLFPSLRQLFVSPRLLMPFSSKIFQLFSLYCHKLCLRSTTPCVPSFVVPATFNGVQLFLWFSRFCWFPCGFLRWLRGVG